MRLPTLITAISLSATLLISGCASKPDITYDGWKARQTPPRMDYTHNEIVKINLNWSRIGPFSRYDTWLRSNVFGGQIDIYGAQTCLGKFVRHDGMLPANGWWEIVCPDDSYAAGDFRLNQQGDIIGSGADTNGEQVSFILAIPN